MLHLSIKVALLKCSYLYTDKYCGFVSIALKMASSGKKGKKKGTVISLQSFLANGDIPVGTTQVAKKVRSLEGEESDDGVNALPLVLQLPTAPRANRIFDDDSVPHNPPYIAYLTNLPFDAKEEDLHDFFGSTPITSLRLPREEGETGRVRGFGYVEFENREDLINTLSLPDPCIKGRRIRIELSNESEQLGFRQRGNRRGFEGFNNSIENRESTNWRRENSINDSYGSYDRNLSRERKYELDDSKTVGSWRSANRINTNQNFDSKLKNNDTERNTSNNFKRIDKEPERPKLKLNPRTLPLPIVNKESDTDIERQEENKHYEAVGTKSQKVFGSAKPVDTATREFEIEERMSEARRQQRFKQELDQNDISEKIGDIDLQKAYKDNTNYTTSWRKKDGQLQSNNSLELKDKFNTKKIDNRQDENNLIRTRDSIERLDKSNNLQRDAKQRDETKVKKITKHDRTITKNQENNASDFRTSNKYSGLCDETSD